MSRSVFINVRGSKVQGGFFAYTNTDINVNKFLADNLNKFVFFFFFLMGLNSSFHSVKSCTC